MFMLFEINIFALAVLDNNKLESFMGKCIVITGIFIVSRFMHIYETIFNNSKNLRNKNFEVHLSTLGENISL